MSNDKFKPVKDQYFWFVQEYDHDGLPDLKVTGEKYDPKNKTHKKLVKNNNCYATEDEAYESLM